jgi:hypothetical protein
LVVGLESVVHPADSIEPERVSVLLPKLPKHLTGEEGARPSGCSPSAADHETDVRRSTFLWYKIREEYDVNPSDWPVSSHVPRVDGDPNEKVHTS